MPKKKKSTESNESSNGSVKVRRPKSTPAKATTRKARAKAPVHKTIQPTDEEIRLRAYFIAERRHRLDLPGDADSDWLEAKTQLLSELAPR